MTLGSEDIRQLEEMGIPVDEAYRQIRLFENPPSYASLERPCRVGDGIRVLTQAEIATARHCYEEACAQGRLMKFVPASGAASRMFRSLLWLSNGRDPVDWNSVERLAEQGNENAAEVCTFIQGIERFAFFEDLRAAMSGNGLDLARLLQRHEVRKIVNYLLTERGLNYAALAKGLLKFHRYPDGSRTAFEEHLVEAAAYVRDGNGVTRTHLTVSAEHLAAFQALLERIAPSYEARYGVRLAVDFSVQKRATDTLAVDLENRPFRTADGRLFFRPGGHGALIENLNDRRADVIYIQNIDNVLPDHLRGQVIGWKQMLTGYLVAIQRRVFEYLAALSDEISVDHELLDEAIRFAADVLSVPLPAAVRAGSAEEQRAFLLDKLDRPLRVSGAVRNTGEPGGGPFWVRGKEGMLTLQIVESAQVDPGSPEQQSIYAAATHFNPVNLVCGVRDWRGKHFDLRKFVDPDAVFIARKSKDGRELKALERPGLWNGGMAHWLTVFVEAPDISFVPVKTVNDLLRPQHQPPDDAEQ